LGKGILSYTADGSRSANAIGVARVELMPQYQDLGFQPPPRFEAVTQHADEKKAIAIMR
jgi:hypothetical protein